MYNKLHVENNNDKSKGLNIYMTQRLILFFKIYMHIGFMQTK